MRSRATRGLLRCSLRPGAAALLLTAAVVPVAVAAQTDPLSEAEAAHRRGDREAAERAYRRAAREEGTHRDGVVGLVTVLSETGRYQEAEESVREAMRRVPADLLDLQTTLGEVLLLRGDRDGAGAA